MQGLRDRYVSPTDSVRPNFSIAWMEYLKIFTLSALLLETRLVVSDPSALKFFFQNPYKFFRPSLDALSSNLINGTGAVFSEIASNPVWQELVREEIVGLQDCLADTEEVVLSVKLDSLACLNAHIKETLRFYPGVPTVNRIILEEMHIPLAKLIPLKNKTRSIWGKDAGSFNPLSGLAKESPETEQESSNIPVGLGPYANLSSFIGGPRVCVGWRFSPSLCDA
ncbi:hypothetical protein C8R42DRAFT_729109 [Lentinula raphanica]|nr:hypothetical protein C8R42DRAFT_729109 [Lentinula raphanica]